MCSIAGSSNSDEVWKMLETMRHRSPDGIDVSEGDFAIGMGKLGIVDTTNAEFPMTRRGYTITFNGEIYNHGELRLDLISLGYEFETFTDTEVLLYAFIEWGELCLSKLNGMFAFAVRTPEGHVFLARDMAGEKPVYYTRLPFKFASEAKALGFWCRELNRGEKLWYKGSEVIAERWYFPKKVEVGSTLEEATERLELLLGDAVKIRIPTDVPYALYLSDGIDSNLIKSFHNFDHVYTYQDGDYSYDFHQNLRQMVWHLDSPVKSFSAYGLFKLAQRAKADGMRVVLSGEGADELFGGYVRYVPNEFNRLGRESFPSYAGLFPYRDYMLEEFNGNMQELLRMGDRMAASQGIENRCPFLDKRVVEFAWSLPMEWKIKGFDTKIILRNLLKKRTPSYQFKEKHGLYCSVNNWIPGAKGFEKDKYLAMQEEIWKTLA